jgi:hypothetical protein
MAGNYCSGVTDFDAVVHCQCQLCDGVMINEIESSVSVCEIRDVLSVAAARLQI